ncbi:MAG: uL15 family ribosomal protein [Patescibacteria group bacterium]
MQLHTLKPTTPRTFKKRVGRGGKRGKTSGKGHKGQKARAGHRMRPESRDIIKKLPKRRGYGKHRADSINDGTIRPVVVSIGAIEKAFAAGETVSPKTLAEKGIIKMRRGIPPQVKILGGGTLSKKLSFENVTMSASVKKVVE